MIKMRTKDEYLTSSYQCNSIFFKLIIRIHLNKIYFIERATAATALSRLKSNIYRMIGIFMI